MTIIDDIRDAFSPKFPDKPIDTGLFEKHATSKEVPIPEPKEKEGSWSLAGDERVQQLYDRGATLEQIQEEYLRLARKSWIYANWEVTLTAQCPGCREQVDLMSYPDFWDGRAICVCEAGTKNTTQMDVTCPECLQEFQVTCA